MEHPVTPQPRPARPKGARTASAEARIVLVTGPSGAGRSTAIHVLEDLGYEAIDNIPLHLVSRLTAELRPLALGIDTRNRDFSVAALIETIDTLSGDDAAGLSVLYLDCRADVLLRRFSETRRRHPMSPAESPEIGVERELDLLGPIRARADTLIDTSEMNVHQLREEIEHWYALGAGRDLALSVQSFSYKRGLPRGLDMVFDCRFLSNPYWQPDLRALDGRDARVQAHVTADPRYAPFFDRVLDLTRLLLPAYLEEGKSHLSIAFGCTGGQHRSVALAEALAAALAEDGRQVSIRHRELERRRNG
ncbi:MAG: RNase adapter RapZ [Rhodobacteraceae bacterium]|nr:MAG: RNase adapter RapZ [Paracoccaceae bacterium]